MADQSDSLTGRSLRLWRVSRGLRVGQLAGLLGISRVTLWEWEVHGPPNPTLVRLALGRLQQDHPIKDTERTTP